MEFKVIVYVRAFKSCAYLGVKTLGLTFRIAIDIPEKKKLQTQKAMQKCIFDT